MNSLGRSIKTILIVSFVLWAATLALADPAGRVARLQYMSGSVSIQPKGTDDWVEATLNRPLTNADNVWTDKDSRAELNVGTGILRMNAMSSVTLINVSDDTVQIQLHQGTLNVRVRHLWDGEIYEIDTPNLAFTIQKSGEYRFDVDPDGDASVVTVWKGEGDATGDGPAVRIRAKEQVRFTNGPSLTHSIGQAPGLDGFDDWCRVRDQREDHSYSARYVPRGTIGYEDLDEYGQWREVEPYGPVWVPAVAPGWAPYHYGHWVWIDPWGWTWVDDAPWGFAPFHYGRWVYYNSYWGWVPGPLYVRPYYAPALVAWFGGPGWGVGLNFGFGGGIGWCPLGWREPFFPWYGVSRGYFRNVNITNTHIVNITNVTNNYFNNGGRGHLNAPIRYANLRAPNGAIAVPRDALVNSRPVHSAEVRVPANAFTNAHGLNRVPFEPNRNSVLGVHAGQRAAAPSRQASERPVFSKLAPPAGGARAGGPGIASISSPNRAMSEHGSNSPGFSSARPVPRPPQAQRGQNSPGINQATQRGNSGRENNFPQRGGNSSAMTQPDRGNNGHYVPRPPENRDTASNRASGMSNARMPSGEQRSMNRGESSSRSVPRPPESGSREGRPSMDSRGTSRSPEGTPSRPSRSMVPRPTGRVLPARESRGMDNSGRGYSRGESSGPWNQSGRSESPSYRGSGGQVSYGRSASSGEYSGGGRSGGGYSSAGRGGYSGGRAGYSGGGGSRSGGGGGSRSGGSSGGGGSRAGHR